jgi:hypothetical protein
MTKTKKILKKAKPAKKVAAKKLTAKKAIKPVAKKHIVKKVVVKKVSAPKFKLANEAELARHHEWLRAESMRVTAAAPKEKLADQAELVTHGEWLQAQVVPVVEQAEQPVVVPAPVLTTPAYSHLFHSVEAKQTPKKGEIVIPTIVSLREKLVILAGVTVFALMIGGMWLKITVGYFQTHKFTDGDVVNAASIIGEGFKEIKNTKEQLIHNAAAAVETQQAQQEAIDEANKVLGSEVQKLLDQKNNNQVQN